MIKLTDKQKDLLLRLTLRFCKDNNINLTNLIDTDYKHFNTTTLENIINNIEYPKQVIYRIYYKSSFLHSNTERSKLIRNALSYENYIDENIHNIPLTQGFKNFLNTQNKTLDDVINNIFNKNKIKYLKEIYGKYFEKNIIYDIITIEKNFDESIHRKWKQYYENIIIKHIE